MIWGIPKVIILVGFFRIQMCGGRHLVSPESDVCILGLSGFCDMKLNFHCAYIGTNWVTLTVEFMGVGIPLME